MSCSVACGSIRFVSIDHSPREPTEKHHQANGQFYCCARAMTETPCVQVYLSWPLNTRATGVVLTILSSSSSVIFCHLFVRALFVFCHVPSLFVFFLLTSRF